MDLCSGYGMWLATTGFRTCSPPISGCRRRDILASERDGTTLVLSKAIVELQTSDFYSPHHVFSSGIGIGDSLIRKGVVVVRSEFLRSYPARLCNLSATCNKEILLTLFNC